MPVPVRKHRDVSEASKPPQVGSILDGDYRRICELDRAGVHVTGLSFHKTDNPDSPEFSDAEIRMTIERLQVELEKAHDKVAEIVAQLESTLN